MTQDAMNESIGCTQLIKEGTTLACTPHLFRKCVWMTLPSFSVHANDGRKLWYYCGFGGAALTASRHLDASCHRARFRAGGNVAPTSRRGQSWSYNGTLQIWPFNRVTHHAWEVWGGVDCFAATILEGTTRSKWIVAYHEWVSTGSLPSQLVSRWWLLGQVMVLHTGLQNNLS